MEPSPYLLHCPVTGHRFCGRTGCFAPFPALRRQFNDLFCASCIAELVVIRGHIKNAKTLSDEYDWRVVETQFRKRPDSRHCRYLGHLYIRINGDQNGQQ